MRRSKLWPLAERSRRVVDSVSFITVTFDWQGVLDIKLRRKFRIIQRTVPSFCTGKRKERWSNIMNCLVLPILLTPRTFCTNFTYFYLLYPSVSLFWNAQDSHVIAYARIPCRFFHINPRTTPQFIGRSITGNGSFNELREGCLSRFGLSYFLYWCNQERCVLGLLTQTLRKLVEESMRVV